MNEKNKQKIIFLKKGNLFMKFGCGVHFFMDLVSTEDED